MEDAARWNVGRNASEDFHSQTSLFHRNNTTFSDNSTSINDVRHEVYDDLEGSSS